MNGWMNKEIIKETTLLSVLLLLPLIVAIFVVAIIVIINMIILIKSVGTVILAIFENKLKLNVFFSSFVMKPPLFIALPSLIYFRFLFSIFSV